ncbi:hypothetical protein HRbin37_01420 [bacterium HR37]|nr:hypothetical protein HRbin37_01420 [bacterium HR37]
MNELHKIKQIIIRVLEKENFSCEEVILFGSRARKDFREDSDWDILVIVKEGLNHEQKKKLWYEIYTALHKEFPISSFDLILKSKSVYEEEKLVVNTISNEAYIEGIKL